MKSRTWSIAILAVYGALVAFTTTAALLGYRFVRVETLGFRHREHGSSLSKQEIPALEGRVKFLRLWADDARLVPRQQDAMREELSRTLLRLRRARWFGGLPATTTT